MRWKTKPELKEYDERERMIFAWLPRRCDDGFTYWLTFLYARDWWFTESWSTRARWKRLCRLPIDHPDVPAHWRLDPSLDAQTLINGERR